MANPASAMEQRLLGAWQLIEWSEIRSDGTRAYPLGENPVGQLMYTPDGHVSAQLVRRERRNFESPDFRSAQDEEASQAFREYFGYFGTFSVDIARQVITHHVVGSWFPNLNGKDQERRFRFDADRLTLDADTDWGKVSIVWSKGSRDI